MKAVKDLSYKNVPKRICLTGSQKLKRCEVIRSWIRKKVDFETVLFTNEVCLSVDGPEHFMSWQLNGYLEQYCRVKRLFDGGGIMLHGALNLDETLSVVKVEKTLTGLKYIDLLKEHVLPQIRAKNQPGIVFQHDNAPCNQAKVVKDFMINEDLECLSWPPHSPDLSLIEHAWKMLKDLVYSELTIKK